jgi:hypothetical protein
MIRTFEGKTIVQRLFTYAACGLAFSVLLGLGLPVSTVAAGTILRPGNSLVIEAPAALDDHPVLEDPLTAPGVVTASACPTGRNDRQFVGEGYRFRVTGKCLDTSTNASVAYRLQNLVVPDGEVSLDVRTVSGADRARFRMYLRDQGDGGGGYAVTLDPVHGGATLSVLANNQVTVLAENTDITAWLAADGWNTLAMRTQGPNFWVLLNGVPIISASDSTFSSGGVFIALSRLGELEDTQEAVVVLRNLRVSRLAGGDQARVPTYQGPTAAPAPAAPAPSGAPWIGDVTFGLDPSGSGAVPSGGHLPIVDGSTVYAFFSWRNLPAGSQVGVTILFGRDTRSSYTFTPSQPSGRYRAGVARNASSEGGGIWDIKDFHVLITLNGQELARGDVTMD